MSGRIDDAPVAAGAAARHSRTQLIGCLAVAVVSLAIVIGLQNVAIARFFPITSRLSTEFSSAYLKRELLALRGQPGETIFLGDSILWGFRLQPDETAAAILTARGCACRNLSYKHGSPVNYYALARILQSYGVRPGAVVIEVNREVFGPTAEAYRELSATVSQMAMPLLTPDDVATFTPQRRSGFRGRVDRALASVSLLYAMRTDIREAIYGDNDPPPPPLEAGLKRRLYDLPDLDESNVSIKYLEKTLELFRTEGIPVIAFLVPVNHVAIDPYVDAARYRRNSCYLDATLARGGARVYDLDASFAHAEFVDEAHLNGAGQRRLASILAGALRAVGGDAGRP